MRGLPGELGEEQARLVREELDHILASPELAGSQVLKRLLAYLVEQTAAGNAADLKAITLSKTLFNRDPGEPAADNVVRTAAARLRSALSVHNMGRSSAQKVRITLPKGGYTPIFEFLETSAAAVAKRPARQWPKTPMAIAVVTFVAVAATTLWWVVPRASAARPAPTIYVEVYQDDPVDDASIAHRIRVGVPLALAQDGLARVVPTHLVSADLEDDWGLRLILHVTEEPTTVLAHLLDETGVIRWSTSHVISQSAPLEQAIKEIASGVLGDGGAVPALIARAHETGSRKVGCLALSQIAYRGFDVIDRQAALSCLRAHLDARPNDAAAWAALALHLASNGLEGDGAGDQVRHALVQAMARSPNGQLSPRAGSLLILLQGDAELADQPLNSEAVRAGM